MDSNTTEPLHIYTDGGCFEGVASWAYCGPGITPKSGTFTAYPTSNRAEMRACIEALEAHPNRDVIIYSDSQYVVKSMMDGWKRKANLDMWDMLEDAVQGRKVIFKWVRGHNGDYWNEMADTLATNARDVGKKFDPKERIMNWFRELHPMEKGEIILDLIQEFPEYEHTTSGPTSA